MPLANGLNASTKLALPPERPMIRAREMLKNINMKMDLDIMFGFVLCMLVVVFTIQAREIRNLQTQIQELKIVVDQKFLPAMILDREDFTVR